MVVEVRSRGSGWAVFQDGEHVSDHRKKERAKEAAREVRGRNETLRVQRSDGTFQGL